MSQTKHIDYAAMVKQFAGDKDLFTRFATRFMGTFEQGLKKIEDGFSAGDAKLVKIAVHAFKNLVCNFHAHSVYRIIVEMEKLAAAGALETAKLKMEEVVKGTNEIANEIKDLLKHQDPLNLQ